MVCLRGFGVSCVEGAEAEMIRLQKRFVLLITLLGLIIVYAGYTLYWRENGTISVAAITDYQRISPDQIEYAIEGAQYQADGSYLIQGWCVQPGITYPFYNYGEDNYANGVYNNIHVGYLSEDQVHIVPTRLEQREDVNQIMDDGIDYKYCGFQARIPEDNVEECRDSTLVFLIQNPDGTEQLCELERVHDYE